MRLKKKIIEKIEADKHAIAKLCAALDKAYPTIKKYLNENNELLTTADALEALGLHFGLTNDQLLDRQKAA